MLAPLGWTASGCRHVAALDNDIVNSLNMVDRLKQCVGDPFKKGGGEQCKYGKSCVFGCILGDQKLEGTQILPFPLS